MILAAEIIAMIACITIFAAVGWLFLLELRDF